MIDENIATEQLKRLSGLSFFPSEKAALRELRLAVQAAANVAIAEQVITDWLHECSEAPKPADLRKLIWDRNEERNSSLEKCSICGGEGQVTVWILETFVRQSSTVKGREYLRDFSFEKERELSKTLPWNEPQLGDNQRVVSAAKPCECRMVGATK